MKPLLVATLCALSLTGCASEYLIITQDGTVLTSLGKPHMDRNSGLLEFEDTEGRKQQIPQDTVKTVIER